MAPSTQIEVPPELEVKEAKRPEPKVKEPGAALLPSPPDASRLSRRPKEGTFQASLIEYNRMKSSSRFLDTMISLTVNFLLLAVPIFAGLFYTDTINLKQLEATFLIAPPPPPPPPPPPATAVVKAAPARRVFESAGKLIAPTVVPKTIAEIKEAPLPPDVDGGGVPGGVLGGVPGGSMGGVIGGVIGGVTTAVPAAPLTPKESRPRAPVRVGGRVRQPRLISRVDPVYPPLAKQTHMQGIVIIDAILDEQGSVVEAHVVSGPPLLIQAALDAVRRWKYEPTYLNDQPVAVQLNVTVTFRINE